MEKNLVHFVGSSVVCHLKLFICQQGKLNWLSGFTRNNRVLTEERKAGWTNERMDKHWPKILMFCFGQLLSGKTEGIWLRDLSQRYYDESQRTDDNDFNER